MKADLFDIDKNKVGEVELSDDIFGAKVNSPLIYESVKMQLTCRRQGDAFVKSRELVSGTTAKIYRQKGTGRARHSDLRANLYVGGGKSFGPRPKDYTYSIPKKARRGALRSALSSKVKDGDLMVLKEFAVDKPKTSAMVERLQKLGVSNGLVVVEQRGENVVRSIKNIPHIKLARWDSVNIVDVLKYKQLVITEGALTKLQEILGK